MVEQIKYPSWKLCYPRSCKYGFNGRFPLFSLEPSVSTNDFSLTWCLYNVHAYTHNLKMDTIEFVQCDFSQFCNIVQS